MPQDIEYWNDDDEQDYYTLEGLSVLPSDLSPVTIGPFSGMSRVLMNYQGGGTDAFGFYGGSSATIGGSFAISFNRGMSGIVDLQSMSGNFNIMSTVLPFTFYFLILKR